MPKWRASTLIVFFLECALLFIYARHSHTFISPKDLWRSFSWAPASGPFEITPFLGLLITSIAAVFIFGAWMVIATGIGLCLLNRLQDSPRPLGQCLLISCGLGLGTLSLAVFILGITHLLYPASILMTAIIGILYCEFEFKKHPLLFEPVKIPHFQPQDLETLFLLLPFLICLVMVVFHFLGVILPPTSFDEMDYQLALPKLYVINHALVNTPFNHLSYLPKNISMIFTLGLLSGSATISKLFSFSFGLMATVALYFFGKDKIGKKTAALGAMIFFLIPVIGNQMRNAVADLGAGFYESIAVFLFLEWLENRKNSALFLSSILWGLALGSKYTTLPGFSICALIVTVLFFKSDKMTASSLFIFLGPAPLLFIPTLIWNFYQTGNPLTPILSSVIHSRNFFFAGHYKPLVDYASGRGIPDYFPLRASKDVLFLPWRIFAWHNDYNHDLGAALLLGVPLAFLSLKEELPQWLQNLAIISGLYWFFWVLTPIHISRYFVAGLALTSVLFGWITLQAVKGSKWKWILLLPLLLALSEQGMRMIQLQNDYKKPWGYLAGRTSLSDYLDGVLIDTPYDAENFANRHIPKNATILVFDEFRTYYLNRNFIAATPWDHELWHELVYQSRNGEELANRLHALGISYFLANDNYLRGRSGFSWADPWTQAERLRAARFIAHRMKRLYTSPTEVWLAQIK